MAVLPIIKIPDQGLKKETEKVEDFSEDLGGIIEDLRDTLNAASNPEGVGLSANQIGISKQICIVRKFTKTKTPEDPKIFKEYVMINPKITYRSKDEEIDWEGCLSVPNTYGKVSRPQKIRVKYKNEKGKQKSLTAKGFTARVIQHEIDHLNGILFTSKVIGDTIDSERYFSGEAFNI